MSNWAFPTVRRQSRGRLKGVEERSLGGSPRRDASLPGWRNHCPVAWRYLSSEENNAVFGRTQSFVAGPPPMFSSWSRARKSTRQPAVGGSLNSTTANPPRWRCKTAIADTCQSKRVTLSLRVTHLWGVLMFQRLLTQNTERRKRVLMRIDRSSGGGRRRSRSGMWYRLLHRHPGSTALQGEVTARIGLTLVG
jgi:hypothetical protein